MFKGGMKILKRDKVFFRISGGSEKEGEVGKTEGKAFQGVCYRGVLTSPKYEACISSLIR